MRPDALRIVQAMGGYFRGHHGMCRCPAHDDATPSLSVTTSTNGFVLVHCFAKCSQDRVLAALRLRGLWPEVPATAQGHSPQISINLRDRGARRRGAQELWTKAMPAGGTLVETYLRARGIEKMGLGALRYIPSLKHNPSATAWPAMIALVTRGADGTSLGVHRTFLARDGSRKAPVEPQRMMLGPCRGGAVRLGPPGDQLMIGEGIETCLAAMQASGHPAWAALSTSGMRALDLPRDVRDVIVLADGDDPGEAAAQECARRWKRQGRRVRVARPPRGMDFNDLLISRAPSISEGRL